MAAAIAIRVVEQTEDIDAVRGLLRDYAEHLKISVGAQNMCFTSYEQEVLDLPGPYGLLLLARVGDQAAGCVLLKEIRPGEQACEMKRLWVGEQFRGLGLGRKLAEHLLDEARRLGYRMMYLDTVPASMKAANQIYAELGFTPFERYNDNPVPDVVFFRRAL